jgi:putative transposase
MCSPGDYPILWTLASALKLLRRRSRKAVPRTVKYEEVYLRAYQDGKEARISLGNYFLFYNSERPHQALGYRTPAELFVSNPASVITIKGDMIESITADPLRIAGLNLNIAPILS